MIFINRTVLYLASLMKYAGCRLYLINYEQFVEYILHQRK